MCEGAAPEEQRDDLGCELIKADPEAKRLGSVLFTLGLYKTSARVALMSSPYWLYELVRLYDVAQGERAALDKEKQQIEKMLKDAGFR